MINAVNPASQIVNAGLPIPFASNRILKGCSARHEPGSSRFVLTKPGVYKVVFNATFSTTAADTALIALEADGEPITSATISVTTAANNLYTNTIETLVEVFCGSSVSVTANNLSTVPLTLTNADMIIERLCG